VECVLYVVCGGVVGSALGFEFAEFGGSLGSAGAYLGEGGEDGGGGGEEGFEVVGFVVVGGGSVIVGVFGMMGLVGGVTGGALLD